MESRRASRATLQQNSTGINQFRLFNGTVEAQEAMVKQDVYKNVLQRVGWALPRHFCINIYFFKINEAYVKLTF
jgi:hypothetical protein